MSYTPLQKKKPEAEFPVLRRCVAEHYHALYEFSLSLLQDTSAAQAMAVAVMVEGNRAGVFDSPTDDARQRLRQIAGARFATDRTSSQSLCTVTADKRESKRDFAGIDIATALNRQWLSHCLSHLSRTERRLLDLTHCAKLSHEEIASLLGSSPYEVVQAMAIVQNRLVHCLQKKRQQSAREIDA